MVRSMIAGVAGLRAHQSKMDVIGNNIANVNTWGFKGYSYNFKDSMYTNSINSSGGSALAGASGGRNASQVGYGSQLSSISNVFETGAPSPSSRPMDCMIDGTGFFLVGPMVNGTFTNVATSGLYLSRVGIFSVDENGYLVDDQRSYVYGYALVDGTGVPEQPAKSCSYSIPDGKITYTPAVAATDTTPAVSAKIEIAGVEVDTTADIDVNPNDAVADWLEKALTDPVFKDVKVECGGVGLARDANGDIKDPREYVVKVTVTAAKPGTGTQDATTPEGAYNKQTKDVVDLFNGTPELIELGSNLVPSIDAEYSEQLSTIRIPVDPYTGQRYKLENYSILEDGTIIGVDEQKRVISLGQVALISVQNPNGLEKTDGYYYTIGDNTGDVYDVKPGSGPTGTILGSYLEMANVDLANEFSNIITTQRGFQANSKIITVTDEMLQELVNMKR